MGYVTRFVNMVKLVVSVLPALIDAVKTVEAICGQTGAGSYKLELVRGLLEAAYEASDDVSEPFEKIWNTLNRVVGGVVSLFNATGQFDADKTKTKFVQNNDNMNSTSSGNQSTFDNRN